MITPETIAQSGWTSVSIAPRAIGQTSERVPHGYELLSIGTVAARLRHEAARHEGGELLALSQLRAGRGGDDSPVEIARATLGRIVKMQSDHSLTKAPQLPDHDGSMLVTATTLPTKEEVMAWKQHTLNPETGLPFAEDSVKAIGFVSIGQHDSDILLAAIPLDNKRSSTVFHVALGEQFFVPAPIISESSR